MSGIASTETTFYTPAEELNQEKYHRSVRNADHFLHTPGTMEKRVQQLHDKRVQSLSDGKGVLAEWSVDGAVIVRGPAPIYVKHQFEQWTKRAQANFEMRDTTLLSAGIIGLLGLVGSAYKFAGPILGPVLGTGAALLVVVAVKSYIAANSALAKAAAWGKVAPATDVADERLHAYQHDFANAYSKQLKIEKEGSKTAVLNPIEVKEMYEKYFSQFATRLMSQNPSKEAEQELWMKEFRSTNPISSKIMQYGMNEIPAKMKSVVDDFDRFDGMLQGLKKAINEMKHETLDVANKDIARFEAERQKLIKPWKEAQETTLAKAKEELRTSSNPEKHKEALETYQAVEKITQADFDKNTAPINQYFDQQIKEALVRKEERLKKLSSQEMTQLSSFYPFAKDLLSKAVLAWKGETYQGVEFPWQAPSATMSEPPMFAHPARSD